MGKRNPALAFQADKDGMTPLHWAADRGSLEVAEALIKLVGAGPTAVARVNCRDDSGDTALHYAVLTDNLDIGQLLVKHNADSGAENNEGETPLSIAEGQEWQTLLTSGCD